jgi:hypothetical protein
MKPKNFLEQVFLATTPILRTDENGKIDSNGTGFYCGLIKDEVLHTFLVSNKHVFDLHTQKLNFIVRSQDLQDNYCPEDNYWMEISDYRTEDFYEHPNEEIDLAILKTSNSYNISESRNSLHYKISINTFYDSITNPLFLGQDIFFVGYPETKMDELFRLPLLGKGYIASVPEFDFNYGAENKGRLLIGGPVFGGSSGSPVFTYVNRVYSFIGIVSERLNITKKNKVLRGKPRGIHAPASPNKLSCTTAI